MKTNNDDFDIGEIIIMIITISVFLFFSIISCSAQTKNTVKIDTVECHNGCISKFIDTTTNKDKKKYFAIYNCTHNGVSDIIPISTQVYEYIKSCREYGIEPSLAIRLKNNIIFDIIKYKPKYCIKNEKNNVSTRK